MKITGNGIYNKDNKKVMLATTAEEARKQHDTNSTAEVDAKDEQIKTEINNDVTAIVNQQIKPMNDKLDDLSTNVYNIFRRSFSTPDTEVSITNETVEVGFASGTFPGDQTEKDIDAGIDLVSDYNDPNLQSWTQKTYNKGDECKITYNGANYRVVCKNDGITSNPNGMFDFDNDINTLKQLYTEWEIDSVTNGGTIRCKNVYDSGYSHYEFHTISGPNSYWVENVNLGYQNTSGVFLRPLNNGFRVAGHQAFNNNGATIAYWVYQTTHVKSLVVNGYPMLIMYNPYTLFIFGRYIGTGQPVEFDNPLKAKIVDYMVKNAGGDYAGIRAFSMGNQSKEYYSETGINNNMSDDYGGGYFGNAKFKSTDEKIIFEGTNKHANYLNMPYFFKGFANSNIEKSRRKGLFYTDIFRGKLRQNWPFKSLFIYSKSVNSTTHGCYLLKKVDNFSTALFSALKTKQDMQNNLTVTDDSIDTNSITGLISDPNKVYLVQTVIDNDNGSGLAKYTRPSKTSQLKIDGKFAYHDSFNDNGYNMELDSFTGNVDLSSLEDGEYFLVKEKGTNTFRIEKDKPCFNELYTPRDKDDIRIVKIGDKFFTPTYNVVYSNAGTSKDGFVIDAGILDVEDNKLKVTNGGGSTAYVSIMINGLSEGKTYIASSKCETIKIDPGYKSHILIGLDDKGPSTLYRANADEIGEEINGVCTTTFIADDESIKLGLRPGENGLDDSAYFYDIQILDANPVLTEITEELSILTKSVHVENGLPVGISNIEDFYFNSVNELEVTDKFKAKGHVDFSKCFNAQVSYYKKGAPNIVIGKNVISFNTIKEESSDNIDMSNREEITIKKGKYLVYANVNPFRPLVSKLAIEDINGNVLAHSINSYSAHADANITGSNIIYDTIEIKEDTKISANLYCGSHTRSSLLGVWSDNNVALNNVYNETFFDLKIWEMA